MKITINKLLIGILAFLLIVNLLVIFNLNYFYIQMILAFIFLITILGLLIMLCFKIRSIGFWEYLVYVIGLSVAFIMFAGLAVNWILPWLHITDKPLSLYPILISFDIFILILMSIASKRNKDLRFDLNFPKFSLLDRIFIIIPMIFPVLSILGALILNNNGPNYLTMIMLVEIAVYVFGIILFRKKLNEHVYPWAILMISISLILMGWLRGWYLNGADVSLEYQVSEIIRNNQLWSMELFHHEYNSCLSVSLLPSLFSLFLGLKSTLYFFKLILPLLFSFLSLGLFLLFRKFGLNIFSFIAVFFFITQPSIFVGGASIPARQEIAFLFLGLMLLVLFSKEINPYPKKALFLIFGFSMVVSHYSTTYIALAIFILTYIITFFYREREKRKIKKGRMKQSERQKFFLTLGILFTLLFFSFLWYSQLTQTSTNIERFSFKILTNLEDIFSNQERQEGSLDSQWNLATNSVDAQKILSEYTHDRSEVYKNKSYLNLYLQEESSPYPISILSSDIIKPNINVNLIKPIYSLLESIKKIVKIFIFLGCFYFFIQFKKNKLDGEWTILVLSNLIFLIVLILLPFVSIDYSLSRLYQQNLFVLSLAFVSGVLFLSKLIKKEISLIILLILILFPFFLYSSGAIQQIIGGADANIHLDNYGREYNEFYSHKAEANSAIWLRDNLDFNRVYTDRRGESRLFLIDTFDKTYITKEVFPFTIDRDSYVYLTYMNYNSDAAILYTKQRALIYYKFPSLFLSDKKNEIYDNGGSKIYR